MNQTTKMVVIDARNGLHLRDANEAEVAAYRQQATATTYAVRISATESVTEYAGPGIWFGGAGF